MSVEDADPCPLLESCGACNRMHLSMDEQLRTKKEWVSEKLSHTVTATFSSPSTFGYRARIRMRFGPDGYLGYHQSGSHHHIAVNHCPIAHPTINAILPTLPQGPHGATLELRTNGRQVQLEGRAVQKSQRRPLREWLNHLDLQQLGILGVSMNGKRLRGKGHLALNVGTIEHRLSPGTFYQVNLDLNERLVKRLSAWVKARNPVHILDLYAGAGNLSFPLAMNGHQITMIESGKSAINDAKECAKRLGLQVRLEVADAGKFKAGDHFFDLVILDPPRAGAPGVMEQLLVTRPGSIAYVSCNPNALARDLKPAFQKGYTLDALEVFDMFPHTSHVEVLALLTRD